MTDIVERLEYTAKHGLLKAAQDNCHASYSEARDEIVRLRAEVERLVKSRNKWGKRYNDTLAKLKLAVWTDTEQVKALNEATIELKAERDRLRDALTGVEVYGSDTLSGRSDGPNDAAWYREGVAVMRDRARAALKGDTPETTKGPRQPEG